MRSRYVLGSVSGLFLAVAFPGFGVAGLAWVAPGCLLFSAAGVGMGSAFRIGYAGGLTYYLVSLHWLLFIPFPAGAVGGWLALSMYLALYPAAWVWLCWWIFPGRLGVGNRRDGVEAVVGAFVSTGWVERTVWGIAAAVIWVALEMVVSRLWTGFPWNLLGVSQYEILPLIQVARVTGVYGVTFLMVWLSVALGCGMLWMIREPMARRGWKEIVLPLGVVFGVSYWGYNRATGVTESARRLKVALVQPSIPQTLIWDRAQDTNRFNQLIDLSERALTNKPDLLVWPEAAVPNLLRFDPWTSEAVTNLAVRHKVWIILGADDIEPRLDTSEENDVDYYNSSFLVSPDGELIGRYRKQRLVIFGEYIPLVRWLPFLKYFTPIEDGFRAGTEPMPFAMRGLDATTSVLICFEDVFPHLTRSYVEPDTDFLLNLTNNGWFGESAAQWQHAANAVFRAVENGLPLVRCANNGLTCWVDAHGGLHEVYFNGTKDIYGPGFKIVRVPLLGASEKRLPTFYTRHGDWFGWGCVGLAAVLIGGAGVGGGGRGESEQG